MALKKPTFEQEPTAAHGDTATVEAPAPAAKVEAPVAKPEAQEPAVAASTAIAKASASSVAVSTDVAQKAKAFAKEFEEMKGAADFSYGNHKVFKGNNGSIVESGDKGEDLGRWAKVRMLAWDTHTEISPGESGASTRDFVAYSKDGVTVDSVIGEELKSWAGRPVADYVEYLRKEEEFSSTKVRRFIDMGCYLEETDSGEGPIGTVIQITLSESSIPSFSRYEQELKYAARCSALGLKTKAAVNEDPFMLYVVRELASKGNQKWTKLLLTSTLPAKL